MKRYRGEARRKPKVSGGQLTSGRWKRLRAQVIKEEPLCQLRLSCCTVRSDTVDHIIPVSFRPDLKFLRSNLRGSCQACNMRRGNRSLAEVRAEDELLSKAQVERVKAVALEFFDV